MGHLTTDLTLGAFIYSGEGPAAEVHEVVVTAIDADRQAAEDVPIYRIRTVSALTGIPAKRIRRWDGEYGLIHTSRTKGGHRLFSDRDVRLLRDIRRLVAEEGMSVQAVKSWLEGRQSGG